MKNTRTLIWALTALACGGLSGTALAQEERKKPEGGEARERPDRPDRPERPERPPGGGRPGGGQFFKAMDENGDGKVTKKEFKAFHLKRLEEMFTRLDADKSGDITEKEMANIRRRGPGGGGGRREGGERGGGARGGGDDARTGKARPDAE